MLFVLSHIDSSACACSYSRGMWGKAVCLGLLLWLSLSQLATIALICSVRKPFTVGLSDTAVTAHIAITMKSDHRVIFAQGMQDRGRSYIQLRHASLICMLLCVESLTGHGYTE